jgi:hypothetical protein
LCFPYYLPWFVKTWFSMVQFSGLRFNLFCLWYLVHILCSVYARSKHLRHLSTFLYTFFVSFKSSSVPFSDSCSFSVLFFSISYFLSSSLRIFSWRFWRFFYTDKKILSYKLKFFQHSSENMLNLRPENCTILNHVFTNQAKKVYRNVDKCLRCLDLAYTLHSMCTKYHKQNKNC